MALTRLSRAKTASVAALLLFAAAPVFGHVRLIVPNGGEQLRVGSVFTVQWTIAIQHTLLNWDLWYSVTGSNGPWIVIEMNLPPGSQGVGSLHEYDWVIPNAVSDQVRVRVRMDNAGTNYEDISDADNSIVRPLAGDLNCDGTFNGGDIDPFFLALGDPTAYQLAFPKCDVLRGDMNCDQTLNGADIDPFFSCLAGIRCPDIAINQQPQGQDLCVGNTLTLSVDSDGISLTFQWRKDGTLIPGATQATYQISAVTPQDAGIYEVRITNPCGTALSDPATITVATLIFTHPFSQTVCENDPVLFSVTAVGQGLTYQWRKDGVEIPGATATLFIIAAAQLSDGGVYDVVVTSTQCAQISEPATLTVQQCP